MTHSDATDLACAIMVAATLLSVAIIAGCRFLADAVRSLKDKP